MSGMTLAEVKTVRNLLEMLALPCARLDLSAPWLLNLTIAV
jgi:hypothetical protein